MSYKPNSYFSSFAGHLIPSVNDTYTLGTSANKWKDLFVTSGTIYIGDNKLSVANNELVFNDKFVTGCGSYNSEFTSGSWTISGTNAYKDVTHNLSTDNLIYSVKRDSDGSYITSNNVYKLTVNSTRFVIPADSIFDGEFTISTGGGGGVGMYVETFETGSWDITGANAYYTINHNLNTDNIFISLRNTSTDEYVLPSDIIKTDNDNTQLITLSGDVFGAEATIITNAATDSYFAQFFTSADFDTVVDNNLGITFNHVLHKKYIQPTIYKGDDIVQVGIFKTVDANNCYMEVPSGQVFDGYIIIR
jgi:hypothetical protein